MASSWVRLFGSGTQIVLENVMKTNLVGDDFAFI